MTSVISSQAKDFLIKKFTNHELRVRAVSGGYSRNRRAIIDIGNKSLFAKEVDVSLLPDDGETELGWLKKDYDVITELAKRNLAVAPEWAELDMDGRLLLLPSYKEEDGWHWSPPKNKRLAADYVQAVITATKDLEATKLPEELTDKLSLQPFFRDEIAHYDGIDPILSDDNVRNELMRRYEQLRDNGGHLVAANAAMVEMLHDDKKLRELQEQSALLASLPNDSLNHCDVRSDNTAYNEKTGQVKFVDWNWASYAPKKFGATEFLLDMARRGVDVLPFRDDLCRELLAASVKFFMIRSLKPPLTPGSNLRDMQAETAAVAYSLYEQLRSE